MSQSYEEDFRTYIRNLPFTITEHILRGFARSHGFQVSRCCIVRKNMRYGQNPMCSAFLTLHSEAEMWRLIGLLDHQYHPILGPMMLQCEKAVPRIRQWAPAEPAVAQHDEYQDIYPEPETQDPAEYLQDPTEYLQPEPDLDDGALGQALEAAAEQDLGTADGAASETPTEVAPEGSADDGETQATASPTSDYRRSPSPKSTRSKRSRQRRRSSRSTSKSRKSSRRIRASRRSRSRQRHVGKGNPESYPPV